jgi:hypothetical protein
MFSSLLILALLTQTPDAGDPYADMDPELVALLKSLDEEDAKQDTAAAKAWKVVLDGARKPNPDCAELVTPSTRALYEELDVTPAELQKNAPAYLALARCAEKQKYWGFMVTLGGAYAKANKADPHLELIIRAALGAGEHDLAKRAVEEALKQFPTDANLLVTSAKVNCRLRRWEACRTSAKAAMDAAEKLPDEEKTQVGARATKYEARASLHLGDLGQTELLSLLMGLYPGDEDDLEQLKQQVASANLTKFVVEPEVVSHLALGTWHLAGRIASVPTPVRVFITNVGPDEQVRVEATLQGLSTTASKTVTVRAGKEALVEFTPSLLPTFKPSSVRATRPTTVALKVTAGQGKKARIVFEDTRTVDVEPRDFLPMFKQVDAETQERENAFYAAWVTPNAKPIDEFLKKAKLRSPNKAFDKSAPTVPQVKALFEELKARGVSYVSDPHVNSGLGFGQRTRLPAEVLASTNAQCLEGTLLYASLLEAIGLSPVLVLVPGHAFVGWRSTDADGSKAPNVYFLETTMTGTGSFERAMASAQREFQHDDRRGKAISVRIGALRAEGVTPQPYD